jgi:hypothetical protein
MSIYWMKTADVYPDGGWREDNAFSAFDPDVRFPRFHMVEGDEPIGNIRLVEGGPMAGKWRWSMTVALPGQFFDRPVTGVEEIRAAAGRRVIEVYQHYLATRQQQYPRDNA